MLLMSLLLTVRPFADDEEDEIYIPQLESKIPEILLMHSA